MKKLFLTITTSFLTIAGLMANDFEKGMQKGLELLNNAKTTEASIETMNYFERIAEANKNEWLPLYYAAYSCLKVGFQQEKSDLKDEWYKKGLTFIDRAKELKKDESELFAMEAYLKLMYISNSPMMRAPVQTSAAIELLEKAKALNPNNPRPWFIHGQNTFYTPGFFGGGATNAKPLLEKAISLYVTFVSSNSLMPVWGKERCEKLLEKCSEQSKK